MGWQNHREFDFQNHGSEDGCELPPVKNPDLREHSPGAIRPTVREPAFRNERHARFLHDGDVSRRCWNDHQSLAGGTSNLLTGELLVALQVLAAMNALKFKLIHKFFAFRGLGR